jgi:methionyl-tRNA synthetase
VLHVAAQAVDDCKTILTPFLPFSAQTVHELLGGTGTWAPQPRIEEVDDLDGGAPYPVITGDYRSEQRWESVPLKPGTPIRPPTPVYAKLDVSVVDDELARLEARAEQRT